MPYRRRVLYLLVDCEEYRRPLCSVGVRRAGLPRSIGRGRGVQLVVEVVGIVGILMIGMSISKGEK